MKIYCCICCCQAHKLVIGRILVRFGDYPGLFLYHCHNLEHEDMGMMRNYLIEGSAASV